LTDQPPPLPITPPAPSSPPSPPAPSPPSSPPPAAPPRAPAERRRAYAPPGRPVPSRERRNPRWREFRLAYPGLVASLWLALIVLIALDAWLIEQRANYAKEIHRLRSGMTAVERRSADLAVAANENHLRVLVALIRRQAQGDRVLHLSIEVDSGVMTLEQEGNVLREMPVRVAPERRVGVPPDTVMMAAPRGTRHVERVLTPDSAWAVPKWVWLDRHLPADSTPVKGALGDAIILDGGTMIYGDPVAGPLADSAYVLPGSIRAREADLKAIEPNLKPGTSVYFY
jgi:hypothetical protein